MIRYLSLNDVVLLHHFVVTESGGADGLRDIGSLASAVSQPQMSFAGQQLYATLAEKAAALAFSLVSNHPFVDGNKRVGHIAMETFLYLNGFELAADVAEQERMFLNLAAGQVSRDELVNWVTQHVVGLK